MINFELRVSMLTKQMYNKTLTINILSIQLTNCRTISALSIH